jgi:hypothetical protein
MSRPRPNRVLFLMLWLPALLLGPSFVSQGGGGVGGRASPPAGAPAAPVFQTPVPQPN